MHLPFRPTLRIGGCALGQDRLSLIRQVLVASGFASYLAGINPAKISDEDLASETGEYRLIRIRLRLEESHPGRAV